MIKILMIPTSNFVNDGITNSIMNYYKYIDKQDIQIDFVVPNKLCDRLKKEMEANNSKYYELNRKKNPIKYIIDLKNIIKREKYDIVHAHGSSAILLLEMYAAKLAGCKIRISHSRNTKSAHPIVDKLLRPFFYRTYTHGFACGKDAGKWLFGNREFTVIPNGNDVQKFKYNKEIRQNFRKEMNLNQKKVIGHVGRFNYQKNHEFLIDIFYELTKLDSNAMLVLIGEGKLFNDIKEKVKKLGIKEKVIFVGESLKINKWLQAMDIMVFPSRFEGFPNVVVEWQIAGLPCIISDTITTDVKLTNLVQFMSLETSPKQWAEKINQIEIIDREKIQEENIKMIREKGFDISQNANLLKQKYIEIYNQVNDRSV